MEAGRHSGEALRNGLIFAIESVREVLNLIIMVHLLVLHLMLIITLILL